jgi:hypothetical protein
MARHGPDPFTGSYENYLPPVSYIVTVLYVTCRTVHELTRVHSNKKQRAHFVTSHRTLGIPVEIRNAQNK